jgi:DNA-binding transcriptional LysR family regulator
MQPVSHPNLLVTTVCESQLCGIAPSGWWSQALLSEPLVPSDFDNAPLISIDADDYLGSILANWFADVINPPASHLSVQTYPLARALVEQRLGLAVVDSFTARYPAAQQTIQMRPLAIDQNMHVYALTERSRPPAQTADRLVEFIRQAAAG